jgi:hypothetical protein
VRVVLVAVEVMVKMLVLQTLVVAAVAVMEAGVLAVLAVQAS